MLKKILIFGVNGQLGRTFLKHLNGYHLIPYTSQDLDITDYSSIDKVIKEHNPFAIINCASCNNVDDIEFNSAKQALRVNTLAVGNISIQCELLGIKFMTFSSDYIYDEEGKENPLNIYGKTKLLGEKLCGNTTTVIRVSWLFSEYTDVKFSFVNKIKNLLAQNIPLNVCIDELGKLTYCKDVVELVMELLNKPTPPSVQVYNFANLYLCSRYEVAKYIEQKLNKINLVSITTLKEYNKERADFSANRPSIVDLDCTESYKIFKPRSWEEAVDDYFKENSST